MELIRIILLIMAVVCFYEYKELKNNNIRHDELYFLCGGVILSAILLMTFL